MSRLSYCVAWAVEPKEKLGSMWLIPKHLSETSFTSGRGSDADGLSSPPLGVYYTIAPKFNIAEPSEYGHPKIY